MQVLELNSIQKLQVYAIAERISKKWSLLEISLIHFYKEEFDLIDTTIDILAAPQKSVMEAGNDVEWTKLHSLQFPIMLEKPKERIITELVAKGVKVPQELRQQGKYCVKVHIHGLKGRKYKRGWMFEGIVVRKAN